MNKNGMTEPHWKKLSDEHGDTYECSECGLLWMLDVGMDETELIKRWNQRQ